MKRTRLTARVVVSLMSVLALVPLSEAVAETTPPAPVTPAATAAPTSESPASPSQDASATATPSPESTAEGLLYASGISGHHQASWNPFGGNLQVSVTLRNASTASLDASVQFSATGPFGNQLGKMVEIPIRGLEPDETRTIEAEVGPVGQWGLVTANATINPPAQIGTTELKPMERSQPVFYVPWAIALLIGLALLGWLISRRSAAAAPKSARTVTRRVVVATPDSGDQPAKAPAKRTAR